MCNATSNGARSVNAAVTKMSALAWLSAKSVKEKYESHNPAKLSTGRKEKSTTTATAIRERLNSVSVWPNGDWTAAVLSRSSNGTDLALEFLEGPDCDRARCG